jgi:hypothetical protein
MFLAEHEVLVACREGRIVKLRYCSVGRVADNGAAQPLDLLDDCVEGGCGQVVGRKGAEEEAIFEDEA